MDGADVVMGIAGFFLVIIIVGMAISLILS